MRLGGDDQVADHPRGIGRFKIQRQRVVAGAVVELQAVATLLPRLQLLGIAYDYPAGDIGLLQARGPEQAEATGTKNVQHGLRTAGFR